MIAKSAVGMQHYLDTVNGHVVKWKYIFITEKIQMLIFGKLNENICFAINSKQLIVEGVVSHD